MRELILKAFNKEEFSKELEAVTDFYDGDFERFTLESQLQLLHQIGLKFKELGFTKDLQYKMLLR